jgi:hypothetical protein
MNDLCRAVPGEPICIRYVCSVCSGGCVVDTLNAWFPDCPYGNKADWRMEE